MFGYKIPGDHAMTWGARAIFETHHDRFTGKCTRYIDLVWDRQAMVAGEQPEAAVSAFTKWINEKALPWLRKEVNRRAVEPSDSTELVFQDGLYELRANPNASYGYLYIGAAAQPNNP